MCKYNYYVKLMTNEEYMSTPDVAKIEISDGLIEKITTAQSFLASNDVERADIGIGVEYYVLDDDDKLVIDDNQYGFEVKLDDPLLRIYPDAFILICPSKYGSADVFSDMLMLNSLEENTAESAV